MMHWFPENISIYGHRIDSVMQMIYWIVMPWFVLTEGVLIYFIFRYRRREGRKAGYAAGTTWKALAWVLVPATLVLMFDLWIDAMQAPVWDEIKIEQPEPDQVIRVTGKQFVWEFVHPGPDNRLDTADDIQTLNQLTVPVNSKIQFELLAADVLHSFWVPHLRLKQDAVPGRNIKGWFEAIKEGTYPIACAELCGSGHGFMKGELHVLSQENYRKWLKDQTAEALKGAH